MFELIYLGESGRVRATSTRLYMGHGEEGEEIIPVDPEPSVSIDADFIQAIRDGRQPCCPAEGALSTVRLLEAILRSASNGQPVRLGAPASQAVASR
jgi:predicted dehydrogenase